MCCHKMRGNNMKTFALCFFVLMTAAVQTEALEWFGFTLGMDQTDALALARRKGYDFRPTQVGNFFNFSGSGPDYLSFCHDQLFAIGRTFDGSFPAFVGIARENQIRYGQALSSAEQQYVTPPNQAATQLSQIKLEWDVPAQ